MESCSSRGPNYANYLLSQCTYTKEESSNYKNQESRKRRRRGNEVDGDTKEQESCKKLKNVELPDECASDFLELKKKLSHKSDGDTVAWLMRKAETAVQSVIKKKESERKDLENVCGNYEVNQVWALWDDGVDGMPRMYVRIEKLLLEELKVEVVFLEANARTDGEEKKWLYKKNLPVACGRFKVGTSTSIVEISELSHQVNLERGALSKKDKLYVTRGETWVDISPRDGEIWAVYKDWNANWTLHDLSRARYELVEVVSELPSEESDMTVVCLTRVGKSGAVFGRGYHKGERNAGSIWECNYYNSPTVFLHPNCK